MGKVVLLLCINLFTRSSSVLCVINMLGNVLRAISICLVDGVTLLPIVNNIRQVSGVVRKIILSINLLSRTSSVLGMINLFGYACRAISFGLVNSVTLLSVIFYVWKVSRVMWEIVFLLGINLLTRSCCILSVVYMFGYVL